MLPYGGGRARVTGSTLLLPTNAWDVNYVVADAYAAPDLVLRGARGADDGGHRVQDGTNVTHEADDDDPRGAPGWRARDRGTSVTYTLDQGQYLQLTQTAELTGTAVQSDKPVAVIGASTLMDLPLAASRADSAEQMLPPVRALGSEYVAVRYRSRGATEESVPWRIVGVGGRDEAHLRARPPRRRPHRRLAASSSPSSTLPGRSSSAARTRTHPFYLASYMTGGQPFDGTGDPEFVNVVPPAQYLPRYTFFTDPTYPETNLVVVRARDPQTGRCPT